MKWAEPGAKIAIRSGHGVGKTRMMAAAGLWQIFLHANAKTAATAPSASQLRDVLMSEMAMLVANSKPWIKDQFDPTTMRVTLKGREATNFISARTAKPNDPTALQGFHSENMAFLIDEAFGVSDKVFEVARGSLSTPGARVMLAGNPTKTSGYGFNAFHKNKHLFACFKLSCLDSKMVSKEFVDEMIQEYGEDSDVYKVRVLGEFPSASINQLISRELAEMAALRKLLEHQYSFAPVVLGVDPAWEGDDRSTIVMRQGLHSRVLGCYRQIDNIRLGGLVNQFWHEYKADAVFIDVGWGAGVIDFLRAIGREPIPVNFGGKALKLEYADKRTEMWCEGKKWLQDGGQIHNDEALVEDMIGPEIYFLPNGKKKLESKKLMKARGLPSPDLADGLFLTFAAPVVKLSDIEKARVAIGGNKVETDYDVLQ